MISASCDAVCMLSFLEYWNSGLVRGGGFLSIHLVHLLATVFDARLASTWIVGW